MLKFDTDIQRQIISANLDDFSANAMLPNVHGGQYGVTPQKWRADVISLTYSMLAAGLIAPLPGLEAYHGKSFEEIRRVLQHGDSENGFDVDLVWDVIHFAGTKKLHELLEKLHLDSWQAMRAELSPVLCNILAEMHVVYPPVSE
ncbi:hypothetical protein ACO0K9_18905 [Undibacterium sp. Ji50W]|uniref:hypothetical protein n=1 Tax=Undibacterium sp. Ji50W TaxID=3413041 RepID=UPI003BEFB034